MTMSVTLIQHRDMCADHAPALVEKHPALALTSRLGRTRALEFGVGGRECGSETGDDGVRQHTLRRPTHARQSERLYRLYAVQVLPRPEPHRKARIPE